MNQNMQALKNSVDNPLLPIPDDAIGDWRYPIKFKPLIKGGFLVTSRDVSIMPVLGEANTIEEGIQLAREELDKVAHEYDTIRKVFPPPSTDLREYEQFVTLLAKTEDFILASANAMATDEQGRPLK
jgi:hypothetical protein